MSEPTHDILQLKHCPKCAYDVRFTPEPRCPECGAEFDSDSFDLPVICGQLKQKRRKRRDWILVAVVVGLSALVSVGVLNAAISRRLFWISAIVIVFAYFVIEIRRGWRDKHDGRFHFTADGVFVAESRGLKRIVQWTKVGSVGLKQRRRRGRWRITLLGYWYRIYRNSSTLKFDFVADADDARRVAERLRELRNAAHDV